MNIDHATLVIIPKEELEDLKSSQQEILLKLKELENNPIKIPKRYITAKEFMETVSIKRTKFDQLVLNNKIKTIKKKRKIYVPLTEVERYFNDPSIQ